MDGSCKTKYPILLVHGAGFRDLKRPLYWGRIPAALENRGALVFYGNQDGWGSVKTNGSVLAERIDEVLSETDSEKVNIIGHSKGGLDARMAASSCGCAEKIASITTVATPHRGSKTLDRLFDLPGAVWNTAAFAVNNWTRLIGDKKPDFLELCKGLTTKRMEAFNEENPDVEGIYYQSFAFVMKRPMSDINFLTANFILNRIEGENDGMVSVKSALWGKNSYIMQSNAMRGISHLDEIDFRRTPLTKKTGEGISDICDFYVSMVEKLKAMGF